MVCAGEIEYCDPVVAVEAEVGGERGGHYGSGSDRGGENYGETGKTS